MAKMAGWVMAALAIASTLVAVTLAFADRPTHAQVDKRIDEKQAAIVDVVRQLQQQLQPLVEQAVRADERRRVELERNQQGDNK